MDEFVRKGKRKSFKAGALDGLVANPKPALAVVSEDEWNAADTTEPSFQPPDEVAAHDDTSGMPDTIPPPDDGPIARDSGRGGNAGFVNGKEFDNGKKKGR